MIEVRTLWSSANDRAHVRACLSQGGFAKTVDDRPTNTRAAPERRSQAPRTVRHG
jgi:hypothetical protein